MSSAVLRFAEFELQPDARRLLVRGRPVQVGARAYDLLVALIERSDRVVSKHELLDTVWPNLVVEENNLQVHIHALRRLLGPTAITTIPGRGYRFTAEASGATRSAS
ncbi:MAG: transcriptional regulator, partial [Burkholderiaceae bacterium]